MYTWETCVEMFMSPQMKKVKYVHNKSKNKKTKSISVTIHYNTETESSSHKNYQNIQESGGP